MYDKHLYKIKPLDSRNIENIANDEIWLPKARNLNDPYDCSIVPYLSSDLELKELQELLEELSEEANIFDNIIDYKFLTAETEQDQNWIAYTSVCERIENVGILSFIDTPYNIVTWSHYGNEHQGICIEFKPKTADNLKLFNVYLGGYRLKSVTYTNNIPVIDWKEFLKAPRVLLDIILRMKYRDWSYENETRIITYNHIGGKALKLEDLQLEISKIFIGCEAKPSEELQKLYQVCKEKNIPIVKLQRLNYSFGLQDLLD
ncbi:MAG: DUF2971 domain-containing protein [Cytophagia bacterium]|nr:DUF2971 domain-containing protein [Cytophagia bacterium]